MKTEQTSDKFYIDPKLVEELKEHSAMLGRIATAVEEFCEDGEETTEQCVNKLVAYYCEYRAKEAWERYERSKNNI